MRPGLRLRKRLVQDVLTAERKEGKLASAVTVEKVPQLKRPVPTACELITFLFLMKPMVSNTT